MNDPIVVTRELVKRGWSDFEPKLVAAIGGGGGTVVLTTIAKAYGINVPSQVLEYLPLVVAAIIGWAAPSVGTTVTKKVSDTTVKEQHSGNVVTTATAPTQVQPSVSTPTVDTSAPTEILPPYSRGASILSQLPSATDSTN